MALEDSVCFMPKTIEDPIFIKRSFQSFAACGSCGVRIQFIDNPNAHKEMMAHKCEDAQLGNGIDR